MGLFKALLSIVAICIIYYYMTSYPDKVESIPIIGEYIYDKNPLIVIIITLVVISLL